MRRILGLLCVVLVVRAKNQCDVSTVDFVNVQETVINNTTSRLINGSSAFAKLPVDEELIEESDSFEEFDDNPREDARCLENVTRCAEEDGLLAAVTERITKKLFTLAPPFDLSTVPGISTECNRHSAAFREELQRLHLWALKMYDSTAKLSSGILDGNVNQFGDFDQCLSVKADDTGSTRPQVHGQYCLAYMQVEVPDGPYMSLLHKLSHANYAFRSQLNDVSGPDYLFGQILLLHYLAVPASAAVIISSVLVADLTACFAPAILTAFYETSIPIGSDNSVI